VATKQSLDALLQSATGNDTELEQIRNRLEQLGRGVTVSGFSTAAQKQLQELLGVSEYGIQLLAQRRILNSLAFNKMRERFNNVSKADTQTFKWLFNDTIISNDLDGHEPSDNDSNHESIRNMFINWISSGEGVFHISGKLGSGKSTLMKYICGESRTTKELTLWAGMSQFANSLRRRECLYMLRRQETYSSKILLLEAWYSTIKLSSRAPAVLTA
jgi:ATPase subunit of ABC transporter with duplicated ATPase domains